MSDIEHDWVCVDCIMLIANGDLPDDTTLEREEELLEATRYWVCGDGEEEFSWSPCDCCGSSLGGSRHAAIYMPADLSEVE